MTKAVSICSNVAGSGVHGSQRAHADAQAPVSEAGNGFPADTAARSTA